jgi:hypothetical protein
MFRCSLFDGFEAGIGGNRLHRSRTFSFCRVSCVHTGKPSDISASTAVGSILYWALEILTSGRLH